MATMSAATYDPFAIEKPVLKLGDHGEWKLADVTERRQKDIGKLAERFEQIVAADDPSINDVAKCAGDLCEAACENGAGLSDIIVGLCDEDVHGDAALGVRAIVGLVEFVGEWLGGESSAGND